MISNISVVKTPHHIHHRTNTDSPRPQMNLVNLSTAIHRVAKIVGSDPWLQAFPAVNKAGSWQLFGGHKCCVSVTNQRYVWGKQFGDEDELFFKEDWELHHIRSTVNAWGTMTWSMEHSKIRWRNMGRLWILGPYITSVERPAYTMAPWQTSMACRDVYHFHIFVLVSRGIYVAVLGFQPVPSMSMIW